MNNIEEFPAQEWEAKLNINKDGFYLCTTNNIMLLLANIPVFQGLFAYNRFSKVVDITRTPPWDDSGDQYPRPFQDYDCTRLTGYLDQLHFNKAVGRGMVYECAIAVAQDYSFNPLTNYVARLSWDNNPRLETFFIDALGAADNLYNRTISKLFMIGAIARAISPGCKMDTMLILEGDQGLKKSTAVSTLFGEDWFTDDLADLGSKDAAMQIQGVWAVEIAELTSLNRADYNRAKDWITRRIDKFRAPYGRSVQSFPRQCVFIGTVNPEDGYLKDPTGARRFWPIACTSIDIDYIRTHRDQLWAEAQALYAADHPWWMDEDQSSVIRGEQESRYDEDVWSDQVLSYCLNKPSVTVSDILVNCLQLPAQNRSQSAKKRVSAVLISAGYKQARVRVQGRQTRVYTREF